ncbi:similar to Saccharomyces cerevisiae YGR106C VOA1 Endoplasmic reticulum protein that functions, together with other assembly factors, in assembly of the V0 sector of the vacuolar ATPase (V-ATPase) [Maudiozyma barnettii]|mgnify:CR=1 FL=1|uniref:Similar to Saccharomyces cerevisiae YGR106C VOA1 Endoplasmic reticulum protein that functions, together with other assembly factors, in assembly of the V0 sector of the vacuolar ATPase (V-ATPase) n=1 Tax=Maudiozyma barnettii TaxID=61262 RepID=A0A8H2VAV4_9SACH|nr:Voa1p [Kazachstania barnettii]CAB4251881.1 similar to Saccharomyces cerevisiae YGR106C VOA1 Endoplasmic reticulum protein that functions, together with other assembly factors, in assembly of the V0 sector of the vacuolar ATPase (V-ATPase) [Kazachstania barnettii]CAD1778183.1 similar to Saccharomyces cerevisiae YGR106C VOA1 Endoplasmic reticulum protein that functions, together with other assembly factors, in assembly of the V0 sector of the vacuolar ATPase (V-ATPase) [Kazachstania barnettii]
MKFLSVIALICQLVLAAASTSYVSLRNQDVIDGRISSTEDIIETATVDQPLVILQFSKAKVLESLAADDYNVPFLNQYFKHGVTNVLTDETKLVEPSDDDEVFIFKMKDLEFDPLDILKDANVEKKRVTWFKFDAKEYNMRDLDQYLETIVIFVEEYLNVNVDIVLNSADVMTLEEFDNDVEMHTATHTQVNSKPTSTKTPKNGSKVDDDALSEIWTEGLLMCLLVSFILLVILLFALSWISSLSISYGALEKSTNPLKKNE